MPGEVEGNNAIAAGERLQRPVKKGAVGEPAVNKHDRGFAGPGGSPLPLCTGFDFDGDADVDLRHLPAFLNAFAAPPPTR